MGTGEFAVPILDLLDENYKIKLVVCSPDKPIGRKQIITSPPVKVKALEKKLRVAQPQKLRNNQEFMALVEKINPDLIVVASYGKILPIEILSLPKFGCLNLHGSILPAYRGPSPIQTALLNGETKTGVSLMIMDTGMDTGAVLAIQTIEIEKNDDYQTLSGKLSQVAAQLLLDNLEKYLQGEIQPEIQDNAKATYTEKITPLMSIVDWSQSADKINNQVRAIASTEGVYSLYNEKKLYLEKTQVLDNLEDKENNLICGQVFLRLDEAGQKQWAVKCGNNALRLLQVKLEGRKSMPIKDFINGQPQLVNSILK